MSPRAELPLLQALRDVADVPWMRRADGRHFAVQPAVLWWVEPQDAGYTLVRSTAARGDLADQDGAPPSVSPAWLCARVRRCRFCGCIGQEPDSLCPPGM